MEKHAQLKRAVFLCTLILTLPPTAWARIIYVDDDAPPDGTGETWKQACRDLQSALDVAQAGDEVHVACGTYRPSKGEFVWSSTRYAAFYLISGVAVRGGFAGAAGPVPDAWDVVQFESVLTGDLKGDDANGRNQSDNCFHVVRGDGVDATAVLDGFTIVAGTAEGWTATHMSGGGLTAYRGSPTILRCTFRGNRADYGGAVWTREGNPMFVDCTFAENTASSVGGALANYRSQPQFFGCTFVGNSVGTSGPGGGAVHNDWQSNSQFTHCRFVANLSMYGGAVRNIDGSIIFSNCLFTGNRTYRLGNSLAAASCEEPGLVLAAENWSQIGPPDILTRAWSGGVAGTILNKPGGTLTLISCTLADNSSDNCGGILNSGDCSCTLIDCILWGNDDRSGVKRSSQIQGSDVAAHYCCIQGSATGLAGTFNIDRDPAFAWPGRWVDADDPTRNGDPRDLKAHWEDGDYHLKSQAGRWELESQSWVVDDVTSPCIDAGDPNSPVGEEPEPNGGRINMGAYGGTAEASMSYFRGAGP